MASSTTDINLALRALVGKLTVKEVNDATKEKVEEDIKYNGSTVLFCASRWCGIEVVEAIINKGVDVNQLSDVSIVITIYYLLLNELTFVNN
jgi:hypothetical protein